MDHNKQSVQPSSSIKVERKTVEKNRRNQMKILFSKLNSLLPYNPKEVLPLIDQVDETINYIKSLETNVKLAKEKKESLMRNKRLRSGCSSSSGAKGSIKSPKIEIHEIGSSLQIIVTCGVDDQFIFYEIIRILNEENVEVLSANSSLTGDSIFHIVHAEEIKHRKAAAIVVEKLLRRPILLPQIPQSLFQFGGTKVSDRLKSFVNGFVSEVQIDPHLWDFEIGTENWELLHSIVNKNN